MRHPGLALALAAGLVLAAGLGVRLGSVPISTAALFDVLSGGGTGAERDIVLQLRLPRVALAALVGGGLAVAGATFQALLRNPLAEPYILGISGGASVGAVLVLALGLAGSASWALPLSTRTSSALPDAVATRKTRAMASRPQGSSEANSEGERSRTCSNRVRR